MVPTRILLVDDYSRWRLTARSILEETGEFRIIGEAADGLEAIEKTATLLPDLVLLDIGLPKLNGIEAAKKIRQTSPASKVIFVTQEQDSEIRAAALATGAAAYVVKSRAASELLHTIERVIVTGKSLRHHSEHVSLAPAILPRDVELCDSVIEAESTV